MGSPLSSFFTQATNFTSAVSGGVDPRTGQYGINVTVGTLVANNLFGPKLPLTFSYSPMSTADVGLGTGFSLGLTSYNVQTQRLSLSTGEQYQVLVDSGGNVTVQQKKLNSFDFAMKDGTYQVFHKDGSIEVLSPKGHVRVPEKIYTAAGYFITLQWDNRDENQPRLTGIKDQAGLQLLSAQYPSREKATLTVLPGDALRGYKVDLSLSNGQLYTIQSNALGVGKELLTWEIDYASVGFWGYWASSLTSPGGMVEVASYCSPSEGHQYPSGAPADLKKNPLPFVYSLVTKGKGQPDVKVTYKYNLYNACNFLGFGGPTSWSSQQDNLYSAASTYQYGSSQVHTTGGVDTVIERTYNNYHLLVTNKSTRGDCSTTQTTEYFLKPNTDFKAQPAKYLLPKNSTKTWTQGGRKRSERTTTDFDDLGNPLSKQMVSIDKNNVETPIQFDTKWEYYGADGEKDDVKEGTGCPAVAHKFKRFIKTMTVTPVLNGNYEDAAAQITYYSYIGIDTPDKVSGVIPVAIVKNAERQCSGAQTLSTDTYEYADKSDVTNGFCRLIQTISTHYPAGNGKDSKGKDSPSYSTTVNQTTQLDATANTLTQVQTLSVKDCLDQASTKVLCRFTGRPLKTIDALGVIEAVAYDKLGRVMSHTVAEGSHYERTQTSTYTIDATKETPFSIVVTDGLGNKVRTGLSSSKMAVLGEVQLAGGTDWFTLTKQTYDNALRPLVATAMDYAPSQVAGAAAEMTAATTVAQTQRFTQAYDNWGQNHLVSTIEGQQHWSLTDPIAMTVTAYTAGQNNAVSATTVTSYNGNQQPISVKLYAADSKLDGTAYSATSQFYDGHNQLRKQVDELGRITTYEYDVFGRVTTTTLPLVSGEKKATQVIRVYSENSPSALLAKIKVAAEAKANGAPVSLGTQTFDGLGRVTQRTSGGRTWSATYDAMSGSLNKPSTVTSPNNNTLNYTYVAELGGKVARIDKSTDAQYKAFTYQKVAVEELKAGGALLQADVGANNTASNSIVNTDAATVKELKAVGALLQADIGIHKTASSSIVNTYAATGRLATQAFSSSPATGYVYTVAGRVAHYTDVSSATRKDSYDSYGRVQTIDNKDVVTTLTYDDLGRLQQWVSVAGTQTLTTTLEWDGLGRETKRTVNSSNNENNWVLTQTWNLNHQLNSKTLNSNGALMCKEGYTYDERNRLVHYTAEGTQLPQDEKGNHITIQHLTYDVYNNLTYVYNTFDGVLGADVITYKYGAASDPCQLVSIAHSKYGASKDMLYDSNGALTDDGMGRTFTYKGSVLEGYLNDVSFFVKGKGPTLSVYQYDAMNRMIKQDNTDLYYRGSTLVTQKEGENVVRLLDGPGGNMAQVRTGTNAGTWLTGIDGHGSVLSVENGAGQDIQVYGPWGEQASPAGSTNSVLGYNGEREDEQSTGYHLGNGYRLYNPNLRRFTSPDSMSPFGEGGINAYAYCSGDPINNTDPTGHETRNTFLRTLTAIEKHAIHAVETTLTIAAGEAAGVATRAARAGAEVKEGESELAEGAKKIKDKKAGKLHKNVASSDTVESKVTEIRSAVGADGARVAESSGSAPDLDKNRELGLPEGVINNSAVANGETNNEGSRLALEAPRASPPDLAGPSLSSYAETKDIRLLRHQRRLRRLEEFNELGSRATAERIPDSFEDLMGTMDAMRLASQEKARLQSIYLFDSHNFELAWGRLWTLNF